MLREGDTVQQNAFHLMLLSLIMLGTMVLPILIGLVAVLRDGAGDTPEKG